MLKNNNRLHHSWPIHNLRTKTMHTYLRPDAPIMELYHRRTAPQCLTCLHGHESINGRYCSKLNRYVEHFTTPLCQTS